jgi:class 3 adenylate cyclase
MISLVWVLLSSGTVDDLEAYARSPADALTVSFWPVWFWLFWGTAVAIHFAAVAVRILPGGRHKRRRRRHKNLADAHRMANEILRSAVPPVPATSPGAPVPPARSHRPGRAGRRYVVAMFTDLTGSTTTNEQVGDSAWAEIVGRHRRVVRAATERHSGVEVGTQGDGFFVRFDQPADAAACAVRIQRESAKQRGNGSFVPPVRIGIHGGDAVHDDDDDVLGRVVNIAARLLEVARPHEIVVTEPVADAVELGAFDDRGLVTLKGITQPRHVMALSWD